jgi:uncharacterized membrane protein YqjE
MNDHDLDEKSPGAIKSQETPFPTNSSRNSASLDASWAVSVEQTLQLGDQFVGFAAGVIDLARVEILLAIRTLPNLMMLWLLMMPVMLLTWIAFSVLMAWAVFEASEQIGLGMVVFFLQQVLLLLVCRWLFVKYRTRMTLPCTRAQIDNFIRGMHHEFHNRGETEK